MDTDNESSKERYANTARWIWRRATVAERDIFISKISYMRESPPVHPR
jgi:hypothetical protein